ncbi:jg27048, partial [Pararge aegeria aegeria]
MSGKSYTMKEMKAIVEYLTEHRAYGDIKGRKMWMNLASSK